MIITYTGLTDGNKITAPANGTAPFSVKLELTAAGATKGGMILRLASLLGVARKDIYCIGDHKNDIPMLEVSAVPFAPANAIPAVHEFGAHIVSHCSDGAVADVVEYLDKIY